MKKKINFFIFYLLIFFSFNLIAEEIDQFIEPEPASEKLKIKKTFLAKDLLVVIRIDCAFMSCSA